MHTLRDTKKGVLSILSSPDWEEHMGEMLSFPAGHVVSALFATLCSLDPPVKWHGITALGFMTGKIAEKRMEDARIIMRRILWSLNEESGSIGWGAAEAFGEILASNRVLADEYYRILPSYIRDDGDDSNYLELPVLRQGVFWALSRLSEVRPELVISAENDLIKGLGEEIPFSRACAALALGRIKSRNARPLIERLLQDDSSVDIYMEKRLIHASVSEVAHKALLVLDESE